MRTTLGTGRNAASASGSESSTDDGDEYSPLAKFSAPFSPTITKRKDDASSKHQKLSRSDRAEKGEKTKSVNASEDKSNVQSKKGGQQKEDVKKKEVPLQSQQKAGEASPSPHKRKQQTEHAIQKRDLELKSRRTVQTWTPKDELLLASHFLIDMKYGKSFPLTKGDHYWEELRQRLQGKLQTNWSKLQIYDKYRRMKLRYDVLKERLKSNDTKLHKYKGAEEEKIFKVFQQLWGKENVESKQRSEKSYKTSPTSSEEEDESSSSSKEEEEAAGEERDHAIEEEEETSKEDDKPEAEKCALEPAGKKSKLSKVFHQQELDENGMQNDAELSDHKTVLGKAQGQSHISGSEEFEKALQSASLSLLEESQTKLLVIFKEDQAKTHALIEKIFKEEQAKTHALIGKIVKEFMWFSQLLTTSLPVGNMCAVLPPRLLEGFTDSIHSEDSANLQQEWLQQQTREIEVNIQRSQLMQDILRIRQEQLKAKSN